MKTTAERIEIAENFATEINSKISYASGRFLAKAWAKNDHVRIYWCNSFISVNADGSIDTDTLKRSQKIDAAYLIKQPQN